MSAAEADTRRLILPMSISLDGFAAHSDHRLDWLTPDDDRSPDHGDQRHRLTSSCSGRSA